MFGIVISLLVPPLLAVYTIVILLTLDMDSAPGQYALIVPVCYILGSIPWGFLITLGVKGVDIRQYGSGMVGTSNVLRTAGGVGALLSLILDLSKGLLAVGLARVISDSAAAEVVAGLLALAGHNWPIFLGFRGGRGIVTGAGGLLMMEPLAGAISLAVFAPITLLTRYLSLGSMISVVVAFIAVLGMVLLDRSQATYLWYAGIGAPIIIWQHRDNIGRLLKGNERRLGQQAEQISEAPSPDTNGG